MRACNSTRQYHNVKPSPDALLTPVQWERRILFFYFFVLTACKSSPVLTIMLNGWKNDWHMLIGNTWLVCLKGFETRGKNEFPSSSVKLSNEISRVASLQLFPMLYGVEKNTSTSPKLKSLQRRLAHIRQSLELNICIIL